MRLHFYNVHVHVLPLADFLASDDITNINDALVPLVRLIVKENVLRAVVRLINQEQLATAIRTIRCLKARTIL